MRLASVFNSPEQRDDVTSFVEGVFSTSMGDRITEVYAADESFEGEVLGDDIRVMFVVEGCEFFADDTLNAVCSASFEDYPSGTTIDAGLEMENADRGYGTVLWAREGCEC